MALAVLCWLVLAIGGCGAAQPDVIATDKDNGGRVQVRSGQLLDIVLADDYDETRCQWRKDHNSGRDIVDFRGQRYEWDRTPPAGRGNGTSTMRYLARQTGTARISLVESDNSDRVCRRFAVDVEVGPPSMLEGIASAGNYAFPYVAGALVVVVTLGLIGRLLYFAFRSTRE
ncbi:hypothetical protein AWC31_14775 [Mycolicibacterium wolinskyi]|uniref:Lipoprotein n=1 Tax=Mycolicibacterium wolinskyi TaxID=59750 RepID=A0A1X2FJJ1_9MYCO|nr:hypothetical protein AWC31_14775 [Mycolicibacterium wolinskyi]